MTTFHRVAPMTASLKGYFEPKMHLAEGGKTLCGKDWKAAGWMVIDSVNQKPENSETHCKRCMKALMQ